MKFTKAAITGLLAFGFAGGALAHQPPLDRPSPPPCCADGHCFANSLTYGWYETRWRRWPCECVDSMPGNQLTPAGQQPGDLPVYEQPSAEEEDRRAPLPTAPRGEDTSKLPAGNTAPGADGRGTQQPGAGGVPAGPPMGPLGPLMQPGTQPESTPRRGSLPAYEPQGAGSKSINAPPTGPSSDLDPPPVLPFGPRPITQPAPLREANQRPVMPVRQATPAAEIAPSDDPPPSLPVALASYTN